MIGLDVFTSLTLADLQANIDAYIAVNGKPRTARSTGRAAGEFLEAEFVATDKVLDQQLDGLLTKFKASQPSFYASYVAAREIVDNPGGHNGKNGTNGGGTPTPTPQP